MLNEKTGLRELAYIVKIDDILPIQGSDNCECAVVGGWHVMVRKGTFHIGDAAVYFEIDSKVDVTKPQFSFLAKYDGKVKSQKYTFGGKGNFLSQGLIMPLSDFGWTVENHPIKTFVTKELDVTYYDPEDNLRKNGKSKENKYAKMAARNPQLFKKPFIKWLMRREWGRKILWLLFKNKNKGHDGFPTHFPYIKITDEERCENCAWVLEDKTPMIVTEKLDGTSSTYILERKSKKKFEFYVLSRRVRQFTPDQKCYHDDNIYWNMAFKYNIEKHLREYLEQNPSLDYVCIQGESVGNVQGNPLKLKEDSLYCYNFIISDCGRVDSLKGKEIVKSWGMNWVPIINTAFILPDTMEELKSQADGFSVLNPLVMREGLVYRKTADNTFSFKNVSNKYLLSKGE